MYIVSSFYLPSEGETAKGSWAREGLEVGGKAERWVGARQRDLRSERASERSGAGRSYSSLLCCLLDLLITVSDSATECSRRFENPPASCLAFAKVEKSDGGRWEGGDRSRGRSRRAGGGCGDDGRKPGGGGWGGRRKLRGRRFGAQGPRAYETDRGRTGVSQPVPASLAGGHSGAGGIQVCACRHIHSSQAFSFFLSPHGSSSFAFLLSLSLSGWLGMNSGNPEFPTSCR